MEGLSPFWEGQILGLRYRLDSRLGEGGMGQVWRALDLKLGIEVALKFLHPKLTQEPEHLEMLRREVLAARQVLSPQVCRIFDLVELEGREFISMEFIDGLTLRTLMNAGAMPLGEAAELASQMLAGLHDLHQAGLIHRDLKPDNVMNTSSGRVVLMDLGLAVSFGAFTAREIAGTPLYMSPEQAMGKPLDRRSDLYSLALVLAEMIYPEAHLDPPRGRREFLYGLKLDPESLGESRWRSVLLRCLSAEPEARPESAQAVARALEDIPLEVTDAELRTPYRGLASLGEQDAEFFHGREAEVEALWKKLRRRELLAVVGPSGAGKSSFLRAGVITTRPKDWSALYCQPGPSPFLELSGVLRGGLESELSERTELRSQVQRCRGLLERWRAESSECLLVIDQFEELFTLTAPAVQQAYAALLGEAATRLGIHVLISMRDDFLFHCHVFPALAPVFADLTPLGPPTGESLRRALVQPARRCGYRFENDELVDAMLAEVGQGSGALSLLAFAAARLWEERDRRLGLLTWAAYGKIGGVAGALAQHAEQTLSGLGPEAEPLVRELLRNLVTARGTRASLSRRELLSVFGQESWAAAERALGAFVEARLFTVQEQPPLEEGAPPELHVQIAHESLLGVWPRLVRWRAQDAEAALLRDQLRQVAQLWDRRGRPADLLWSGASYQEFLLWRQQHQVSLSSTEKDFASAMVAQASRRARRNRVFVLAAFAGLGLFVLALAMLWRGSEQARRQAEEQTRKAEASRLLALAQLSLDKDLSAALAHTIASLELAADPFARRFALDVLWSGPASFSLAASEQGGVWDLDFSPDNSMLAAALHESCVRIWSRDGRERKRLEIRPKALAYSVRFSPDGELLATYDLGGWVRVWSVATGSCLRSLKVRSFTRFAFEPDGRSLILLGWDDGFLLRRWPVARGEPETLLRREGGQTDYFGISLRPGGGEAALTLGAEVGLVSVAGPGSGEWRPLGAHSVDAYAVAWHPDGRHVVTADQRGGAVKIWDAAAPAAAPIELKAGEDLILDLALSADGRWLATVGSEGRAYVWSLGEGGVSEPMILNKNTSQINAVAFDRSGQWLALGLASGRLELVPLVDEPARVYREHTAAVFELAFDPAGEWLASVSWDGTLRRQGLRPMEGSRVLLRVARELLLHLRGVADGAQLLACSSLGRIWRVPLDEAEAPAELPSPIDFCSGLAPAPAGRTVAVHGSDSQNQGGVWRMDWRTGQVWPLWMYGDEAIDDLEFLGDEGRLLLSGRSGLSLMRVETGARERLRSEGAGALAVLPGGQSFVTQVDGRLERFSLKTGAWSVLPASFLEGLSMAVAVDASGGRVATADGLGTLLVWTDPGREPHLLPGHKGAVHSLLFDPRGRWLASSGADNTFRLWPLPQGDALHTLPREELLRRLGSLTNMRSAPDANEPGGYRLESGPFPGWGQAPSWRRPADSTSKPIETGDTHD